ncbi:MAG: type II toxin-antitoxin system VapC family toxin [Candidatus Saccharimonadales bacterium]
MHFELLVIDTNFYSAFTKRDQRAIQLLRASQEVALPLTVLGELFGGFRYGNKTENNLAELREFLARPSCRTLLPSLETAPIYGQLYAELKKHGSMIPTNDIWIAALTIEYDGVLATFDRDFAAIPQLKLAIN